MIFLISLGARGHSGSHATPYVWNTEVHVWAGLFLFLGLYLLGWSKAKTGMGLKKERLALFALGWSALAAALLSPVDSVSGSLAWVHMVQHTLIMMVAAPLIALAAPEFFGVFALFPLKKRLSKNARQGARALIKLTRFKNPFAAWCLYALTLWIWHIPSFYESALDIPLLHDFQHIAFFGSSFLFWRVVLYPFSKKLESAAALLYLFISMLHAMALGVLMALSPVPWYAPYKRSAPQFGYTALEDQQLAGLIIWMPAGISFLIAALNAMRKALVERPKQRI